MSSVAGAAEDGGRNGRGEPSDAGAIACGGRAYERDETKKHAPELERDGEVRSHGAGLDLGLGVGLGFGL